MIWRTLKRAVEEKRKFTEVWKTEKMRRKHRLKLRN